MCIHTHCYVARAKLLYVRKYKYGSHSMVATCNLLLRRRLTIYNSNIFQLYLYRKIIFPLIYLLGVANHSMYDELDLTNNKVKLKWKRFFVAEYREIA